MTANVVDRLFAFVMIGGVLLMALIVLGAAAWGDFRAWQSGQDPDCHRPGCPVCQARRDEAVHRARRGAR